MRYIAMNRGSYTRGLLPIALALAAASASAHETWLLPDSFSPGSGATVEFQMSSGMSFPAPGSAITPDRVASATLVSSVQSADLEMQTMGEGVLVMQGKAQEGLNCARVQLKPRILEIPAHDDVEHYLEEIGASESVWNHWRADRDGSLWRESYSKLARTYLRAPSEAIEAGCIATSVDSGFDILPSQDPTQLSRGASLQLKVLLNGQPLAGQAVGVVREGSPPDELRRSNEKGYLEVPLNGTGRYMIYATHLRPADGENFNWESDFVTLTIEIQDQ